MPQIAAFQGLRYDSVRFAGRLDRVLAPPYDVLTADDKSALLSRDPHNIVAVDLPHVPPKDAGPDAVYTQAARTLDQWITQGVLRRDPEPAIYVYHQEYALAGRRFVRRKFLARMRLEPFGTGTVFPHEQTFGGPKEDRFKLMKATHCQLSPVFGLYSDPAQQVSGLLDPGSRPPDALGELDGITNRLWLLTDADRLQALAELMRDKPVFIADGHHRYGTALNYREHLGGAALPAGHPAQFVYIGLCAMEDPGATILPTHRVIGAIAQAPNLIPALAEGIRFENPQAPVKLTDAVARFEASEADICIALPGADQAYLGNFSRRAELSKLAPQQSAAWCELDVAYLHRCLIEEIVAPKLLGGGTPAIQYFKATDQALAAARDCTGVAFLCKPCTMAQLRAVSEAGDLMPQKSTYFYPKLATGLVIHSVG